MKNILFAFLICLSLPSLGQSERYSDVLTTFQSHFNNSDAQAIFDLMEPAMQEAITLVNIEKLVATFQNHMGDLKEIKFMEANDRGEKHTGYFENGRQDILISLNENNLMNGLRFVPSEGDGTPAKLERNVSKLQLPFKGTWFTIWGGDTKAQNYHVISESQRNAFDFLVIGKNNKTYERSGTRNEDYFAFGKPLFAVCDAKVVTVIEGIEDNKPGAMNPNDPTGNTVILETDYGEYIVYAHFEFGTIKVKEGDLVKKGQFLGRCGNSGNSSEAHLHLHIQDGPNLLTSKGVKCYFETMDVNGALKSDYSPIRLDRISPPQE